MKIKQTIITTVFIFVFSGVFASTNSIIKDYIVTEDGITYYEKLKKRMNNFIAVTSEGDKIGYSEEEVKAYRKKGKEYKKLFLVEEGTNYVKNIFLEKVVTKAGYTLYKKFNTGSDIQMKDFYVYYEDKLEMQLNQENHKAVLSFFFSKFNLLFAS